MFRRRWYLPIAGGLALAASAVGLKGGAETGWQQIVLAVVALAVVGSGVVVLVTFFLGATAARIKESNAALRSLASATRLSYDELPATARSGSSPYGMLAGAYRGFQIEVALTGYHGGTPLSTAIRIVDFPSQGCEALLREGADGKVEVDLPRSASSGARPPAGEPRAWAGMVSRLAKDSKFLIVDRDGFHLYVDPGRSVLRWLVDFTDFDIETDPARLREILDRAIDFADAIKHVP
jgi:hypothetical protein